MDALTDQQLVAEFATKRSDSVFAELVRRHIDFVYSAAMRMVRDPHRAQDVTQAVFVALAQNAHRLAHHPMLPGWLHRTTRNHAANMIRSEIRRQHREQEAVMNESLLSPSEAGWEEIAQHLDAGLDSMDDADRTILLLRFFDEKSAREMAGQLGISEDAARQRLSRAVDRLRDFFSRKKIAIGASGLVALISANAVQSAPAGLAPAILATATSGAMATVGVAMLPKVLLAAIA
ncbi:MAG TPA: sigma-70 family RNA polymerase sigma factor, partial [Desulfuromonadaceae bacterium]|nr:sigma-70 family RNA polymerase sigma factor [Desulfuromonadaceae bacterium]